MARVHERRRAASVGAGTTHHKQAQPGAQKKPSYKVVLEEVSEQKKLKTLLSFKAEAPPGFTFIPAGDPQLTNRCKQLARDDGSTVFIVSVSLLDSFKDPCNVEQMSDPKNPELSHEVHRVGYHFSSRVVEKACLSLGVTLTESGRVLQSSFATLNEEIPTRHGKKLKNKGKGKGRASPPKFDLSQSQATIDTQAREAIRDLFPKIPEADLHETVARSFQKGRDLVGTSGDLSLARRAHLAVLAHIRHTHTNYDNILKLVPWGEARKRVEGPTLDVLISWRDDVDDDTNIMRDVLREVIIISDDEDEDDLTKVEIAPKGNRETREKSIEIISASRNVHTQRLDLAMEPSELEDEHRITYIPRKKNPGFQKPNDRLREERRGAQRHQRWEEAVSRQRKGISSSSLYPHTTQLNTEPIYRASSRSDLAHRSRIPQKPLPASLHQAYEHQRISQYNDSQRYFPQQRVENLPPHIIATNKDDSVGSAVWQRQIKYSSEQRPTLTALNPEYYQKPHRPIEPVLGYRHTSPEDLQYARQAIVGLSTERQRFAEIQRPKEVREVQYTNTDQYSTLNDEPRHRRHHSERILPSIEMDESDVRASAPVAHEEHLHLDPPPRQYGRFGREQHHLDSESETRNHLNYFNLKRVHDDDQVYIIEERPKRPPPFEDRDRVAYMSFDGQPPKNAIHHSSTEQNFDKEPVVVQYDSKTIRLPPTAREEISNPDRQVYSVPRLRQDGHGRSHDFYQEHENAVSREIHRTHYMQPTQQPLLPLEPPRALGASFQQPTTFKNVTIVQPSVSRIIYVNDIGDGRLVLPTEEPDRRPQLYDEHGRLVEDNGLIRRGTAMHTSRR